MRTIHPTEFVHKEKLPNGLRVLVHEMPWAQSVSARLLIKAGPRYENDITIGSAHYLEHMFFEGSKLYPSRRELDRAVESKGGNHSAYTDKEYVMYQAKLQTENASFATEFVHELAFNPLMADEAVAREKGIISAELRRSIDTPAQHVWNLLREHIWRGHPLGHNTLGTFESIDRISRQDLLDYHNRFYKPDNTILVIAGNVKTSQAIDMSMRDFGALESRKDEFPAVPPPLHNIDSLVRIEERDIKQVHILLAFDTKGHGESSTVLPQFQVLSKMLRNNIFHTFVYDLGFSYSAGCWPWLVRDGGSIVTAIEVAPEKTAEAVTRMVDEVNNLTINEDTVQEARAGVVSDTLLNLADTDEYANFIGEQELYTGTVKPPEKVKADIKSVSTEDIQNLKDLLFTRENAALVLLGPVSPNKAQSLDDKLTLLLDQ